MIEQGRQNSAHIIEDLDVTTPPDEEIDILDFQAIGNDNMKSADPRQQPKYWEALGGEEAAAIEADQYTVPGVSGAPG